MEFLLVTYPGERDVYVNGLIVGKTNRIVPSMLASGMHLIDLGSPKNYEPPQAPVLLQHTTPSTPCVVEFVASGYRAEPPANKPYIFVAMDFSQKLLSRFHDGILPAAKAAGFAAVRTDHVAYTGNVVTQLLTQIDNSRLLIADLFPENQNVYLEIGYAWGQKKPTVLLVSNPSKRPISPNKLPFDLRQQRYLEYKTTENLKDSLQGELVGIKSKI